MASRVLEDLTIDYPRDLLALQVGHQLDFFRGDARMLRDRIARALPAWSPEVPGYHAVLGMHAFGLEEAGQYAEAELSGRKAVELEPRDAWAQHAVAHVMEMQGRQREGIEWMRDNTDGWSRESFFAVHNWWHLALYHLDLGEIDDVLALFDGPIYGARSRVILDMVDASAHAVAAACCAASTWATAGRRWPTPGSRWRMPAIYAFNDAHAMMAFVGAGRRTSRRNACSRRRWRRCAARGDNVDFTREVGQPVTLAIKAFGDGNYGETVRLLRSVRNIAHRFGGSHAQRDVLDLTLIEAALRAGQQALAAALTAERAAMRPTARWRGCSCERAVGLAKVA